MEGDLYVDVCGGCSRGVLGDECVGALPALILESGFLWDRPWSILKKVVDGLVSFTKHVKVVPMLVLDPHMPGGV